MGLNNSNSNSGLPIVMIKHNALVLESKEPKEGYVKKDDIPIPGTDRGDGSPETMTKYIRSMPSVDGFVQKLEWFNTEDKYEQQYLGVNIYMKDGDEEFILQIPQNRRYFNTFCKIAENIDWTDRVEFWANKDRLKDTTNFGANQNGAGVKYRYTKDNPGPMPLAKQNKTTKKWNFDEQNDWLLENLIENVIPAVNAQLGANEEKTQAVAAGSEDRWANDPDPIHSA